MKGRKKDRYELALHIRSSPQLYSGERQQQNKIPGLVWACGRTAMWMVQVHGRTELVEVKECQRLQSLSIRHRPFWSS